MNCDCFWLTEDQFSRLAPLLPTDTRGKPRVDDRRVISGIVHVLKSGGRWIDAPDVDGPHKTLYNRFVRWAAKGVSALYLRYSGSGRRPASANPDRQFGGEGASLRIRRQRGRKIRLSADHAAGAPPKSTLCEIVRVVLSPSC